MGDMTGTQLRERGMQTSRPSKRQKIGARAALKVHVMREQQKLKPTFHSTSVREFGQTLSGGKHRQVNLNSYLSASMHVDVAFVKLGGMLTGAWQLHQRAPAPFGAHHCGSGLTPLSHRNPASLREPWPLNMHEQPALSSSMQSSFCSTAA